MRPSAKAILIRHRLYPVRLVGRTSGCQDLTSAVATTHNKIALNVIM
jgi:hypothetical protein